MKDTEARKDIRQLQEEVQRLSKQPVIRLKYCKKCKRETLMTEEHIPRGYHWGRDGDYISTCQVCGTDWRFTHREVGEEYKGNK